MKYQMITELNGSGHVTSLKSDPKWKEFQGLETYKKQ